MTKERRIKKEQRRPRKWLQNGILTFKNRNRQQLSFRWNEHFFLQLTSICRSHVTYNDYIYGPLSLIRLLYNWFFKGKCYFCAKQLAMASLLKVFGKLSSMCCFVLRKLFSGSSIALIRFHLMKILIASSNKFF